MHPPTASAMVRSRLTRSPVSSSGSRLLIVARRLAEPLDLAPFPLFGHSARPLTARNPATLARFGPLEGSGHQLQQPRGGPLTVPRLAPGPRLHHPKPAAGVEARAEALQQPEPLLLAEGAALPD